jgi:hypothetical protein
VALTNRFAEGRKGQIHEINGDSIKVLFDKPISGYEVDAKGLTLVKAGDIEHIPRRFVGVLTKYSSRGMIRNWKTRLFEVWADSVTYRGENEVKILGGVVLSSRSEVITDARISKRSDRFPGDPPHTYYCGVYEKGKTLWVASPSEEVINKFKVALQDAINDAVIRDDASTHAGGESGPAGASSCSIS